MPCHLSSIPFTSPSGICFIVISISTCCRWSWEDDGLRPSLATEYTGWEQTEAAIQQALEEHAPIDGLLAFSQGACCAAVYSAKAELSASLPKPQFVVLISGFLPRDQSWADEMIEAGISIPTFHVFGEEDNVIPKEKSEKLVGICCEEHALVLAHKGGHFVPTCNAQVRETVRGFFGDQLRRLSGTEEAVSENSNGHVDADRPRVPELPQKVAQQA